MELSPTDTFKENVMWHHKIGNIASKIADWLIFYTSKIVTNFQQKQFFEKDGPYLATFFLFSSLPSNNK